MERLPPPDFSSLYYATENKQVTGIRHYTNRFAQWILGITGHVVEIESHCINRGSLARFISETFQHPSNVIDNTQFRRQVLSIIDKAIKEGQVSKHNNLASFIEYVVSKANVPIDREKITPLLADLQKEAAGDKSVLAQLVKQAIQDLATPTVDKIATYKEVLVPLKNASSRIKELAVQKDRLVQEADKLLVKATKQTVSVSALNAAKKALEDHFSRPPERLSKAELEAFIKTANELIRTLDKEKVQVGQALNESDIQALSRGNTQEAESGPVFAQELRKKAQQNKVDKAIRELQVCFQKVVSEPSDELQKQKLEEVANDVARLVGIFCDGVREEPAICEGCLITLLENVATTIQTQKGNLSPVALRKAQPVVELVSKLFVTRFACDDGLLLREVFLDVLSKVAKYSKGAVQKFAQAMLEHMKLSKSVIDLTRSDVAHQINSLAELCLQHPSQSGAVFRRLVESVASVSEQKAIVNRVCELVRLKCALSKGQGANFLDDFRLYLFLVRKEVLELSREAKNSCLLFEALLGVKNTPLHTFDRSSSTLQLLFNAAPEASQTACRQMGLPVGLAAELALEFGLQKLDPAEAIHPVYIGTEWAFMADSPEQMYQILDQLSAISRKYPQVTFMPGSIAWCQKIHKGSYACFNTLPVFENGRLIALYHKRHEKMDLDTLAEVFGKQRKRLAWAMSDLATKERLQDYNSNLFITGRGLVCGFEICNDHINLACQNDYKRRAPTGAGVDLHVLMAHGSILNNQRTATHDGSLVAYIDHSTTAQTSVATMQRAKDSQDMLNKDKQARVNQNMGLIGAFKAESYKPVQAIEPIYKSEVFAEMKFETLLEGLSRQLNTTPKEVQLKLVSHLRANAHRYYPQGELTLAKQWTADSFADFQSTLLRRYTFANKEAQDLAVQAIEKGQVDSAELGMIVLELVSELYARQIVLTSDLANLPQQIVDPERKRPYIPQDNALKIGISYQEERFYSV